MSSICTSCAHFRGPISPGVIPNCAAFPKGIPMEILTNGGHDEPYKGDRGIRFQKMTKREQRARDKEDLRSENEEPE